MVCAMHRLFQSEEDDLIMEGKFSPEPDQVRSLSTKTSEKKSGFLIRLLKLLATVKKN